MNECVEPRADADAAAHALNCGAASSKSFIDAGRSPRTSCKAIAESQRL